MQLESLPGFCAGVGREKSFIFDHECYGCSSRAEDSSGGIQGKNVRRREKKVLLVLSPLI